MSKDLEKVKETSQIIFEDIEPHLKAYCDYYDVFYAIVAGEDTPGGEDKPWVNNGLISKGINMPWKYSECPVKINLDENANESYFKILPQCPFETLDDEYNYKDNNYSTAQMAVKYDSFEVINTTEKEVNNINELTGTVDELKNPGNLQTYRDFFLNEGYKNSSVIVLKPEEILKIETTISSKQEEVYSKIDELKNKLRNKRDEWQEEYTKGINDLKQLTSKTKATQQEYQRLDPYSQAYLLIQNEPQSDDSDSNGVLSPETKEQAKVIADLKQKETTGEITPDAFTSTTNGIRNVSSGIIGAAGSAVVIAELGMMVPALAAQVVLEATESMLNEATTLITTEITKATIYLTTAPVRLATETAKKTKERMKTVPEIASELNKGSDKAAEDKQKKKQKDVENQKTEKIKKNLADAANAINDVKVKIDAVAAKIVGVVENGPEAIEKTVSDMKSQVLSETKNIIKTKLDPIYKNIDTWVDTQSNEAAQRITDPANAKIIETAKKAFDKILELKQKVMNFAKALIGKAKLLLMALLGM